MAKIDAENCSIMNRQFVSGDGGDTLFVMRPIQEMTKEEALVHAAWLVTMADTLEEAFPTILKRVMNS